MQVLNPLNLFHIYNNTEYSNLWYFQEVSTPCTQVFSSHLIISWRSSCFLARCNILPLISSGDILLTSWIFILCPTEAVPFEGISVVNTRGNRSLSRECNVRRKQLTKTAATCNMRAHVGHIYSQCFYCATLKLSRI